MFGPSAGKMDDQLKRERIWWSEQTLHEVQKLELAVKQELQKTTAALREQFRRQLEIERNDSQLRDSSLERQLARLRDDFDALREQSSQQQLGVARRQDSNEDVEVIVQQLRASLTQTESSLRLDLDAVALRLEDYHRQGQEEVSVRLAAQQAQLEMERGKMQQSAAKLQEDLAALSAKLSISDRSRSEGGMSADRFEAQLSAALAEERTARSRELEGVKQEVRNLAKDLVEESLSETRRVQTAAVASRADSKIETRVEELVGNIKAESDQRKAEVDTLRVELSREHEARRLELTEARNTWRNEAQRLAEDIASTRMSAEAVTSTKQSSDATARLDAKLQELLAGLEKERQARQAGLEELDRTVQGRLTEHSQKTMSGNSATGETVRELLYYLEEECRARKNDVEDVRQQISLLEGMLVERTTNEVLQGSLTEVEMRVGNLYGDLATECEARRNDSERHQLNQSDLRDEIKAERKLRIAEVEKMRAALAELAINFNSSIAAGEAHMENSQELSKVFASLRAVLDEETSKSAAYSRGELNESVKSGAGSDLVLELAASGGGEKLKAEAGALRSDLSAALGREATELSTRIRGLGTELRNELTSRIEVVSVTLRGEIAAVRAELRADITASSGELQADISRQVETLVGQGMVELRGLTADRQGQGGLQSSAAIAGQLSEVLRLMQIITSSSEVLAEKICGEAAARRSAEGRPDARLVAMESSLQSIGAVAEEPLPSLATEPDPLLHQVGLGLGSAVFSADPQQQQQQRQQQLQNQLQAQTVISEDLKDSLEKLAERVNRMLKPDDATAQQREGSFTPGVRGSLSPLSRSHSPERQRSGFFQMGPDGSLAISATNSAVATPSNPEAAARHPGNLMMSNVVPGALGARVAQRRTGNEGPTPTPSGNSAMQAPKMSDQTKLIQKAVQDLYHENNQLRDELNGQGGSPQGSKPKIDGAGAPPLAAPRGRPVGGAAGGSTGSNVAAGVPAVNPAVAKATPRAAGVQQQGQVAPGQQQPPQGLVRGMPLTRNAIQNPVLANQARAAPQAIRRGVVPPGYGRAGSPSGIAPSR